MKPFLAALFLSSALASEPETYYVGPAKYITILFESNAEIESILGTSHEATGKMTVDLEQGTGDVSLNVPVSSLRTGIALRDEHMRSPAWLDAAAYPDITFISRRSSFTPGRRDQVRVTGDFSLHGVKREITIPVDFRMIPPDLAKKSGFGEGRWVRFVSEFEVRLSHYGVTIPPAGAGKVSDIWKVRLTLFATTEPPK